VHAHPLGADAVGGRRAELADVVRRHGAQFVAKGSLSAAQRRALRAIAVCRTQALGGRIDQCDACGERHYRYHSCRNRHCPKCQTLAKERWLAARRAELLPVPYFHVVFTLPQALSPLAQGNQRALYALLFAAASQTLLEFGRNPRWLGGEIAASLLLHTWSQTLTYHPHLHALVAGGALAADGSWIGARRGFLFPVHALSKVFRGKFLDTLTRWLAQGRLKLAGSTQPLAQPHAQRRFLALLRAQPWVVYAKQTMAGPEQALDYLARYTYKTAISNERLRAVDENDVCFAWRDRAHGNRRKVMRLPAAQFLQRFALHVLPAGFTRIRHYGLLANRNKAALLAQAAAALDAPAPARLKPESPAAFCVRVLHFDPTLCPTCHVGTLRVVAGIAALHAARAPP
jgi:hypothetical protein